MVVKKRVDHGFHVPVIPKAPRSNRRRGAFKKKLDGNQTWAIELLAAVAGKLLLENESSSASSNEKENTIHFDYGKNPEKEDGQYDDRLFQAGPLGQQARQKETVSVPQIDSLKDTLTLDTNQCLQSESALLFQEASLVSNSDCSENVTTDLKFGNFKGINASSKLVRKGEEISHNFWESVEGGTESGFVKHIDEEDKNVDVVQNITSSSKELLGSCVKCIRSPSSKGYIPETLSLKRRIVSLGTRDDDENIFRCNQRSTKVKAYRPIPRRRVKKFLTYKYKKVSSTWKDYYFPNAVRGMWPVCNSRKTYCGRERCQSDIPAKKMKLFDQGSVLTSDRGIRGESFCNLHEKSMKANMSGSAHFGHDENVVSSPPKGHKSSLSYKDSHVRLSIKSLRVPEIFIEVPENGTVGSLKKRVFEAVAAMIGGGVHVGLRLRGRKVRDDSRTLLQTGISSKDNAGTLAFELEPNPVDVPLSLCFNDAPVVVSDSNHQSTRSPISNPTPSTGFGASDLIHDPPPPLAIANHNSESNHDVVLAPAPVKSLSDCQLTSTAIVPYSEMNAEELTMVPMDQKARRSELAQRRTRRPFSVDEVEALVHSVEKLGTGRWRDVKLCAFEGANHRTYVDLKDKWKTLVHTAQIAPQQRRGQPVPQELLDRVLAAHAYWSQHQDKQIGKHQDALIAIPTEV
uniref:Uncharacterized protein n=1 Tax=Kalanchoe fedtschenkoi TaxID=63787 RepID=A0A7N0TMI9_KALFE